MVRFADRMDLLKGSAIRELLALANKPDIISFAGGMPAPELFPVEKVKAAADAVLEESGRVALQYTSTDGWPRLREQIAERMERKNNIHTDAAHILMTSGSQQGLDYSSRVFVNPGDVIIIESPSYLGALNAFNLGWNYPELFATVGAFSPSFWLSSERGDAAAVQRTRLAQGMVEAGRADPRRRQRTRWWIAVGDHEETDDRDGDGVNDAVDDARDLALALQRGGGGADLDWSLHPERREPVAFATVAGGEHNQAAWKRMLPEFLRWAYGRAPLVAPSPLAQAPGD